MKKLFLIITIPFILMGILFLFSCNGGKTKKDEKQKETVVAKMNFTKGKAIYEAKCQVCHQANGKGTPRVFPPLANADYLLADKMRAIKTSLYGTKNPIVVNGIKYNGKMMVVPGGISPEESVDVINYVLNAWGNNGGTVSIKEVNKVIAKYKKKKISAI